MTLCLLCYSLNQLKYSGGWARLIKLLGDSLDSSCLCNNYLTLKPLLEPLDDPCLFNRVSLAEYLLYSCCFLNLVAGEPEVVFGHFYPADPIAGED